MIISVGTLATVAILCFIAGVIAGIFLIALVSANGEDGTND